MAESNCVPAQRRSSASASSVVFEASDWPTTALAWGLVAGGPVLARGSYKGVVWIHDLVTGAVIAGPLADIPDVVTIWPHIKPPTPRVSAVAVAETAARPLVASAIGGERGVDVRHLGGKRLDWQVGEGMSVVALAAGSLCERPILVTGSSGGDLVVWSLDDGRRLCGLRLDERISRVWVVHGAPVVAVRDGSGRLHLFDVAV